MKIIKAENQVLGVYKEILEQSSANSIGELRKLEKICDKLDDLLNDLPITKEAAETIQSLSLEDEEVKLLSAKFDGVTNWSAKAEARAKTLKAAEALQEAMK